MKYSKLILLILISHLGYSQSCIQLNNIAYEQIEKGNIDTAIAIIDKAIEKDSTFFGSYYNKGVIYLEKGNIASAIENFSQSIYLNPFDTASYMNRGIIYSKSLAFDLALKDFKKVIELDSSKKEAYFNIGLNYMNLKNYSLAKETFIKCIDLDSLYHQAIFRLGKVYFLMRNIEKAYEYLNVSIKIYDKDPEYFELRGVLNFMKGNKIEGCSDLNRTALLGELTPIAKDIQEKECK